MRAHLIALAIAALAASGVAAPVDFAQDLEAVFLGLDFPSVWQQRDAILAAHPGAPLAWALVGRSWIEGGAFDPAQAISHCERGLALGGAEWTLAECHLGIAIAHWAQGDLAAAGQSLDATQVSPRSRARQEADLIRLCLQMASVTTDHLQVCAPTQSAVARDLASWASIREQSAQRTIAALGVQPWRRVRVIVVDDQSQARSFLGEEVGYTDRRNVVVYTRADQTPGHEITHAMSVFMLPGHPWGGGPDAELGRGRLINEGLAVALDDSGRDCHAEARRVMDQVRIQASFAALDHESTAEDILYPLAGSFVTWLGQTWGAPSFVQFWCHPGANDVAAMAVYGMTMEALSEQWLAALATL
ncbi:hypothetical protein JXA47_13715 [Candidatus Sumerlaeota bacterium]|nr:hypothetical protein [Candidatus Sumerlaeota bacterium]